MTREAVPRLRPRGRFLSGKRAEGAWAHSDLTGGCAAKTCQVPGSGDPSWPIASPHGGGQCRPPARITQEIIARLEAGTKPWIKPWRGVPVSRPLRACGIPYRGMNVFWLWMVADMCGYASPYWMTYNQAKNLGAQVRKGEKSTIAIFYKSYTKEVEAPDTGEKTDEARRVLKAYPVFNADQVEGLPERFHPRRVARSGRAGRPRGRARRLLRAIPATLRHQGSEAYYEPVADRITMPPAHLFSGFDHYYATLAHELSHWTGHRQPPRP